MMQFRTVILIARLALATLLIFLVMLLLFSCNRAQTVIYQDKIVSKIDTLFFVSEKYDTIPCEDFKYILAQNTDTVFVEVLKNELKVKTVRQIDTVYRNVSVVVPQAKKVDNSVKNIANKGSAVGDGNKITTKKMSWWWIFAAGVLTGIVFVFLAKKYVGVAKAFITLIKLE